MENFKIEEIPNLAEMMKELFIQPEIKNKMAEVLNGLENEPQKDKMLNLFNNPEQFMDTLNNFIPSKEDKGIKVINYLNKLYNDDITFNLFDYNITFNLYEGDKKTSFFTSCKICKENWILEVINNVSPLYFLDILTYFKENQIPEDVLEDFKDCLKSSKTLEKIKEENLIKNIKYFLD